VADAAEHVAEADMQQSLLDTLEEYVAEMGGLVGSDAADISVDKISTINQEGYMTTDMGLVIKLQNGQTFLVIVKEDRRGRT
jgi:hypothetical protein